MLDPYSDFGIGSPVFAAKCVPRVIPKYPNADRLSVMDRDMRLTGKFRAQTDNPEAPLGFEVNNPWKARKSQQRVELVLTATLA